MSKRFGKWYPYFLVVVAAGLLVTAGVALRHSRPTQTDPRLEMIQAGEEMVRESLPKDLRTAFAGAEETQIDALPDDKYLISGWVDLVTAQGRQDRQNYSVVVFRGDNKSWMGERISVIPQM